MIDLLRQEVMAAAGSVVVKIGTSVLAAPDGTLDREQVAHLSDQFAALKRGGRQVVVVSSGAIGAGMGKLKLGRRPVDLPALQAAAAVGQCSLMDAYDEHLGRHGYAAAQILLTAEDFNHRERYLNVRNTILQLLAWNAVPIINENDTVSVSEIRFGDNDQLAAMVTNLLRAPLLVILSVAAGLYPGDPNLDPSLKPIPLVLSIDEKTSGYAGATKSALGSGGMQSKLQAVRLATAAGESVCIASGREPNVLTRLLAGEEIGTLFPATGESLTSWKRWIGMTAKPRGAYVVDAGAKAALIDKGRSLLPVGVAAVRGEFAPGEVVSIEHPAGVEFARGLTNYSAAEAGRLCGRTTDQLAQLLPGSRYEEVVHRDNLVLL
ncbi:MAG TPA: glutamate 5-kinase [Planctomycetia bacterium]|nr:glutamate 5-kinase [Planctomycetia bacterium]